MKPPRTPTAELPHVLPDSPVRLEGWVHRRRELAKVTFLVVRDRTGLAQVVLPAGTPVPPEETPVRVTGAATHNPQAPGGVELTDATVEPLSEPALTRPRSCGDPHSTSACRRCSTMRQCFGGTLPSAPAGTWPPRPCAGSGTPSTASASPRSARRSSSSPPPSRARTSSRSTTSDGRRTWRRAPSSTSSSSSASSNGSTRSDRSSAPSRTTRCGTWRNTALWTSS